MKFTGTQVYRMHVNYRETSGAEAKPPVPAPLMLVTSNGSGLGTWSQVGNITGVSGALGVGDWTGDGKADLVAVQGV